MKYNQQMKLYTELMKELGNISGQKDAYELEFEIDGLGTFRLDIKDLDKLMIKLQTVGKALEGAN
jgi:hypothetical protein